MAIIKGWFDDTERGNVLAVGGYAGASHRWAHFDQHWPIALATHGVPYFHKREMGSPTGVYRKWHPSEQHADEITAFLRDLTRVVTDSRLIAFLSVVRLCDLDRFNKECGLALQPYPLAVYGCMLAIAMEYEEFTAELIFDHLPKAHSKIAVARQYAESDPYRAASFGRMVTTPLAQDLTGRCLPPLQAADFVAWEVRKHHESLGEWFDLPDRPSGEDERWDDMQAWALGKSGVSIPPYRKSLGALAEGSPPINMVWDYRRLREAHELRNGGWT